MIVFATLALAASVAWVLGTTFGYSRYLERRARGRPVSPPAALLETLPLVTAIVATREPAAVIQARAKDLRSADYPAHLLSIVIGIDASVAHTLVPALRELLVHDPDCRIVAGEVPGKAGALNAAVAAASGDVLLFADSHQSFPAALLKQLVGALSSAGVGAATGLVATPEDDGFSSSYWKREQQVRAWQSAHHSVICVTGAVYAMPRALFTPIPVGTICDDLFATMSLASAGYRVVLVPQAIALDPRRFTGAEQHRRRVRTMTGLVQLLRANSHWLRPSRNPMAFDLWVHKANRLALPWVVLVGAASGLTLCVLLLQRVSPEQLNIVTLVAAAASLLFALLLVISQRLRERLAGALRAFTVPMIALVNGLRGRWNVWTPVPATAHRSDHATTLPTPHAPN